MQNDGIKHKNKPNLKLGREAFFIFRDEILGRGLRKAAFSNLNSLNLN